MSTFRPISLEDKKLFDSYYKFAPSTSYEYLFSTLYFWRNLYKCSYAIIDDLLIVKKYEENKGYFFMIPYCINEKTFSSIMDIISNISYELGDYKYLIGDIDDIYLNKFNILEQNYSLYEDYNDFEYIYCTDDLINLSGAKFHSKKNHYNSFAKKYLYKLTPINSPSIITDCNLLINKWHLEKQLNSEEMSMEKDSIKDLLLNIDTLNLKTMAVYVNDNLAGFCIGELVGDTAIIHVERCDINYDGIYSFINREFLINYFRNTRFVNRQEDCGVDGLRQAKMSYHPHHFIKKYLIKKIAKAT